MTDDEYIFPVHIPLSTPDLYIQLHPSDLFMGINISKMELMTSPPQTVFFSLFSLSPPWKQHHYLFSFARQTPRGYAGGLSLPHPLYP